MKIVCQALLKYRLCTAKTLHCHPSLNDLSKSKQVEDIDNMSRKLRRDGSLQDGVVIGATMAHRATKKGPPDSVDSCHRFLASVYIGVRA